MGRFRREQERGDGVGKWRGRKGEKGRKRERREERKG